MKLNFFKKLFLITILIISLPCYSNDPNVSLKISYINSPQPSIQANFELVDGFHLYPESVILKVDPPIVVKKPILPQVHRIKDFTGAEIDVFEGNFSITYPLEAIDENIKSIKGSLEYSGCTDINCFPPETIKFDLPVSIVKTQVNSIDSNLKTNELTNVTKNSETGSLPKEKTTQTEEKSSLFNQNWFVRILLAFLYGFLASLTPCILPMIPITVSIIGSMAPDKTKSSALKSSIIFVLGLAITYSTLGVFAALTGKAASAIMQSQLFLIFLFLLFLFFALAIIEILPFAQFQPATMETANKKGYKSIFLFGLITGLIASPCTGPILLSLLAFIATTNSVFQGFILLFFFALGMGVLFIIAGTGAGSMKPEGIKMIFIKNLFGFLMAIVSLYYLSLAVKGWIFYTIASIIAFFFATALKPEYEITESRGYFSVQMIFCLMLIATGIFFTREILIEYEWIKTPVGQTTTQNESTWKSGYNNFEKLMASPDKKPIFIKFEAEWCSACKKYKKTVLDVEPVKSILNGFHKIKIDCTESNDEMTKIFDKFKINEVKSLPKTLLVSSDRKRHIIYSGAISTEETIEYLKKF